MKTPSIEDCQAFLDGQGPTNSLDKALLAKMSAAELRRKIAQEKESMEGYLKSLEAVRPKNQPAPPARKPLATPASKAAPAPPEPSNTPILDQFEKLEGPAATHFYAANRKAIIAESATRVHDRAQLEREMNQARSSAKQQKFISSKYPNL
jgi:hypothetical protein